jgi:uncharacterized RDD family membrane protein YckC
METAPWYYVSADRQRQGPVSAATIRELFGAGTLDPRSLVWRQGMPQWLAIEQVAGELGVTAPAPPADPKATRVLHAEPTLADAPMSEPRVSERSASVYPDGAVEQAYAAQVGVDPQARIGPFGGPVLYAGFLKRVAASVIDGFIVGMAALFVQVPVALMAGVGVGAIGVMGGDSGAGSVLVELLIQLIGIAIGIVYFGYFYTSAQQASPGKLLVGIKVARPDGETISFARSVGRYFANWINILTLGLSYLLPLFTQKRQALHDLVADTVVVDRWAYTEFPERQDESLGGCAIAVLLLLGLSLLAGGVLMLVSFAAFASAMGA